MVWAIRFAPDFNEFFPRGEFRGYREALAAHYHAERQPGLTPKHEPVYIFKSERPVDGVGLPYRGFQDYASDVGQKFNTELGVHRPHRPPLYPILPHEWPKEYVLERAYKREAALVMFPNRAYAVTQPLLDIIERAEPGVHQFNPIRVLLPSGADHSLPHHIILVGRWLNAFRLEESNPGCVRVSASGTASVSSAARKEEYAGVAMTASEIGDAHLWCERELRGPTFYVSDRLKEEVTKAGLRIPPSFKTKSV